METILTWDFLNLERHSSTGIVFNVHYTVTGNNNQNTESIYGSCYLDSPNPFNFIPYENITKEIVVEWVKGKLGKEKVFYLESGIKTKIKNKEQNNQQSGLPWND